MLVDIRDDFFELIMCEVHDFYVWMGLRHRISNFRFNLVTLCMDQLTKFCEVQFYAQVIIV